MTDVAVRIEEEALTFRQEVEQVNVDVPAETIGVVVIEAEAVNIDISEESVVFDIGAMAQPANVIYWRDRFELSAAQVSAKAVNLTHTPTQAAAVAVKVRGSGSQTKADDWELSGSSIVWNGLGLDGVLVEGDIVEIQYLV